MSTPLASSTLEAYLDLALAGKTRAAVGLVLSLLDDGTPIDTLIGDLLASAGREVGERWQRDEIGVADEHVATAVTDAALHALAHACASPTTTELVVVACAEQDWHSIAARMFTELLRARGLRVVFLGASTPAEHVQGFLRRHEPSAVAVSCSVPLYFTGITRLADAAHRCGVPVLAGGRALGSSPERARRLGADGFAVDVDAAIQVLAGWHTERPAIATEDTVLAGHAVELDLRAAELADAALDDLAHRFPAMSRYDDRQLARTREDLAYITQFIAAAALVEDPGVLTDFLDWLVSVLSARGVPGAAVTAGLEALAPLASRVDPSITDLVGVGLSHLR